MTIKKPLIIDAASDESISQVSPSVPILSNQKSSWHGIKVSYYQHPAAFETPEHCFSQHFITIHLNRSPVVKEQVLNSRLRCDNFGDGDICLTPTNAPVSVRLHDSSELICLYLEPAFLRKITIEVSDVDDFELVPQFKLNDPLIYQIGVALKVNLEFKGVCDTLAEPLGDRLWVNRAGLRWYWVREQLLADTTGANSDWDWIRSNDAQPKCLDSK